MKRGEAGRLRGRDFRRTNVGMQLLAALLSFASLAAQPPAPEALLAEMRAACGGDAWDRVEGWHETGRVDLPGLPGVPYETWHHMRTLTMRSDSRVDGRIMRQMGYDGSVGWQVGPDGQVRVNGDPVALRRMRRDAYLSSFAWFYPSRFPARFALAGVESRQGRTFDVLRIEPEQADSFDLWVDRGTHRVARIVAGAEYAELGDYRDFAGVCSATTGRQGDGDPTHEIVLHVETVATGPVEAALFSPPTAPR